MRLAISLVLLLSGCAAQAWPPAFAFGQSAVGCERTYMGGELVHESCAVEGGAISEAGGRALGVAGRAAFRIGTALGGAPPTPPKVAGP